VSEQKREDGGSAFPQPETVVTSAHDMGLVLDRIDGSRGMSLRDYFAAKVMASNIANADLYEATIRAAAVQTITVQRALALMAYDIADAMLAERAK